MGTHRQTDIIMHTKTHTDIIEIHTEKSCIIKSYIPISVEPVSVGVGPSECVFVRCKIESGS
jgi:hypothetical protein